MHLTLAPASPRRAAGHSGARGVALAAAVACLLFAPAARAQSRVENPFAGARWYVSTEYAANVNASAAQVSDATLKAKVAHIARYPTAFWLDRIAAIQGYGSRMGLAAHLDAALAQQQAAAGTPMVVIVVVYDLPGRDCSALASNGELGPADIGRYKTEFIDPIAAIEGNAKYASLRIVNVIELDSLPNIVTNVDGKSGATPMCNTMKQNGNYIAGVQYAVSKLHAAASNTYNYLDAGHHGWLGWDDNFGPSAQLLADTVRAATGGFETVQGFITNTANYSALTEPYLTVTDQLRASKWYDWNRYIDEKSYATAFRQKLVSLGFSSSIGMLIDTSRNGWGGPSRPTAASTSTDVNTFVNQSRIDRRYHAGNWCNQSGAGIGERPRVVGADGIHAYVWVKPPGESDGASKTIPNDQNKAADQMCDPSYTGNVHNGYNMTGALADAPLAGAWFHSQLVQLVQNAYPPIDTNDGGSSSGGSSSSSGASGSSSSSSGSSTSGGSTSGSTSSSSSGSTSGSSTSGSSTSGSSSGTSGGSTSGSSTSSSGSSTSSGGSSTSSGASSTSSGGSSTSSGGSSSGWSSSSGGSSSGGSSGSGSSGATNGSDGGGSGGGCATAGRPDPSLVLLPFVLALMFRMRRRRA
jgi:cellulose 1,4-beta-cellobiosidase